MHFGTPEIERYFSRTPRNIEDRYGIRFRSYTAENYVINYRKDKWLICPELCARLELQNPVINRNNVI